MSFRQRYWVHSLFGSLDNEAFRNKENSGVASNVLIKMKLDKGRHSRRLIYSSPLHRVEELKLRCYEVKASKLTSNVFRAEFCQRVYHIAPVTTEF